MSNVTNVAFEILNKLAKVQPEFSFGLVIKGDKGKLTVPLSTCLLPVSDMGFDFTFRGKNIDIWYSV